MNVGQAKGLGFAPQVYEPPVRDAKDELDALRAELRSEVRSLRALVRPPPPPKDDLSAELAAIRAALDDLTPAAPKGDKLAAWVRARGIEGPCAKRIAALAKGTTGEPREKAKRAIGEMMTFSPWDAEPRVIALVGPSGVGKTTTIAKLAANARIAGKSVALVSCDGFRVGATDQLERYSELLGAGFYVAASAAELRAVLADVKEDVVFIDTSGRPPTASSPEMGMDDGEVFLCVAAATRATDLGRIVATFAPLKPSRVVVTKVDETESPGALVQLPYVLKKPLAAICDGPRVPEDVAPACLDVVMQHLEKCP